MNPLATEFVQYTNRRLHNWEKGNICQRCFQGQKPENYLHGIEGHWWIIEAAAADASSIQLNPTVLCYNDRGSTDCVQRSTYVVPRNAKQCISFFPCSSKKMIIM